MTTATNGSAGEAMRRLALTGAKTDSALKRASSGGALLLAVGWIGSVGVCVLSFIFASAAASEGSTISPWVTPFTPGWLAGPLHGFMPPLSPGGIATLENVGLPLMFVLYLMAFLGASRVGPKRMFWLIALAQLISALGAPMLGSDQWYYIEQSRMWVVQHLNPYASTISVLPHSGLLYQMVGWRHLTDTYGQLFTFLMAPISVLPLALSAWTTRILMLAVSLLTVWLCGLCASEVRTSPARAMVFLGLNPLVVVFAVGGAHNDVCSIAPVLAAMLLILRARRPGAVVTFVGAKWLTSEKLCFVAGALVVLGIGMKSSIAICAPAVILAARPRRPAIAGFIAAGIALWLATSLCFGGDLPNVSQQGQFINSFSFGGVLGRAIGLGGETLAVRALLELVAVGTVACTAVAAWRQPETMGDGATYAGIALIVAVGWLEPWYTLVFLAMASASRSRVAVGACLAASVFVMLVALPDAGWLTGADGSTLNVLHFHVAELFF